MTTSTISKSILLLVLTVLLFSLPPVLHAESVTEYPEDIAARIQLKYDQMTSLSFSFKQQSKGQMSGRPRLGNGTAIFHKTGKTSRMRWDYTFPEQQVLISDGQTFSMYFADLQQMIVTPADTLDSDLTYSFFSGQGKIADKFHILPPDPEFIQNTPDENQPQAIKLVPKETQSQIQSIHLWASSDSLIRRIEIRDHFDTVTLLNLNSIEVDTVTGSNSAVTKIFTFTPPEGTEIIHQ